MACGPKNLGLVAWGRLAWGQDVLDEVAESSDTQKAWSLEARMKLALGLMVADQVVCILHCGVWYILLHEIQKKVSPVFW